MPQTIPVERSSDTATLAPMELLLAEGPIEITATQAAWRTKLPLADCRAALFELCTRHPARITTSSDGGLTFHFDHGNKRRPSIKRPIAWSDHIFAVTTMLFGPPLMFVLTMQTAALGVAAHDSQSFLATPLGLIAWPTVFFLGVAALLGCLFFQVLPGLGIFLLGLGLLIPFTPFMDGQPPSLGGKLGVCAFLALAAAGLCIYPGFMMLKNLREQYRSFFIENSFARKLWDGLVGMVRGPARPSVWEDALRAQAMIADRGGTFGDTDLMALIGCDQKEAASEAARIVVENNGELVVDDKTGDEKAQLQYHVSIKRPSAAIDSRPAAERQAQRPRLFGCSPTFAFLTLLAVVPAVLGLALHRDLELFPRPSQFFSQSGMEGLGVWPYLPLVIGVPLRVVRWTIQLVFHWPGQRAS